jgi:DNA-binding NarL/FixJ family response regulator
MRILIADDQDAIRRGVIRILQSLIDVDEFEEATNGKEAVEKTLEWKPDIVLLDVRLPEISGFDVARTIRRHAPDIRILFFSIYDSKEILVEARLLGDGFVVKERIVEMLPNALDALRNKQPFFPVDTQADI